MRAFLDRVYDAPHDSVSCRAFRCDRLRAPILGFWGKTWKGAEMTLLAVLHRLYWPSVLFWGAGIVSTSAVLAGLVTWSWGYAGTAAIVMFAFYAALMLAIALWGEHEA